MITSQFSTLLRRISTSFASYRKGDSRKTFLWVAIPALVFCLITVLLVSRNLERKRLQALESSARAAAVLPVKFIEIRPGDLPVHIRDSGVIQAWQQAIIMSEVSGKVKYISAKVGDRLEPGFPILKIDDEMLQYAVEQAEANVLQLEANHETSKGEFMRKKTLFRDRVIADFEFDIARAKEKADRALLKSAHASLKKVRRDLRETLISSPIKGILAERLVDIGTNVAIGTRVATVVDIERIKIKIGISEQEIGKIKEGQEVSVETDAYPDNVFVGTVYSVGTKADDYTLSFPVEIVVTNDRDPVLKPGMVARVAIKTKTYENVYSLPQEAVLNNNGRHFVWTVSNGTSHRVAIEPIDLVGSNIIVQNGLKPGAHVVVSGHQRLFEGSSVQVIE